MLGFIVGVFVGGGVVGWIAHKRPTWFSPMVNIVNAVDKKVNDAVKEHTT